MMKNHNKHIKENKIMNKLQLTDAVAKRTGMTKKDSATAVSAVLDVIIEALAAGEDVKITGFGSFEVKTREARTGRNPQKPDKVIQIPASKAPVFKAGKSLKDAVNK